MDECVYQCPECNFNADNLTELDNHMDDFHAAVTGQRFAANDQEMDNDDIQQTEDFYGENEEEGVNNDTDKLNYVSHDIDDDNYNEENDNDLYIDDNQDDEDTYPHTNPNDSNDSFNKQPTEQYNQTNNNHTPHNLRLKNEALDYNRLNSTGTNIPNPTCISTPLPADNTNNKDNTKHSAATHIQRQRVAAAALAAAGNLQPVINSDNHYERQYTCKRCGFFTNNPRAVLYHRKEFHFEKINVHECIYCQYASQYSGKVERHTLLRHKIDTNNTPKRQAINRIKSDESFNNSLNMTALYTKTDLLDSSLSNKATPNPNRSTMKPFNPTNTQDAQHQDPQDPNTPLMITKYQCNQCPCKYKRSNDLSKHLKMKHAITSQRLSDYLTRIPVETMWSQKVHDENTDLNEVKEDQFTENSTEFTDQDQGSDVSLLNRSKNTQPGRVKLAAIDTKSVESQVSSVKGSYECPYCTYYSNGNDAEYLLHVKDHLSGKSFRCVLCNSVYKYRGDCVVHLKRKHQKADMFAQNYVERFNLESVDIGQVCVLLKPKVTEENENEEKLFGCAYCDYKANYKGDVFKHQTRRHPGVVKNVTALAQNPSLHAGGHQRGRSLNASAFSNSFDQTKPSMKCLNSTIAGFGGSNGHSNGRYTNNNKSFSNNNNNNDPDDYYYNNSQIKESTNYSDEQYMGGNDDDDTENDLLDNTEYNNQMDNTSMFDENGDEDLSTYNNSNENGDDSDQDLERLACKFCPYQTKSHEQLQTHLATHCELKPFRCPLCTRQASFKWDIEKHLRKIHNDYTSEVICLSEAEAKKQAMITRNYIDKYNALDTDTTNNTNVNKMNGRPGTIIANVLSNIKRPGSSLSSLSSSSFSSNNMQQPATSFQPLKTLTMGNSNQNLSDPNLIQNHYLDNLKFLARRRTQHALRERKFKCSLCPRTSKWQWDIRKHMRTVHRGHEDGDVIILKDKDLIKKLSMDQNNMDNCHDMDQIKNKCAILSNRSRSFRPTSLSDMNSSTQISVMSAGTDPTGNKKFKCTACPYRSNWKADLFRHLRKRHYIEQPGQDNVIVLEAEFAANSLAEYERAHGMHIRKRSRSELEQPSMNMRGMATEEDEFESGNESKRIKVASMDDNPETTEAPIEDLDQLNQIQQQENNMELFNRSTNNRLPVSIAELNIKPYKCLKCGFRSDRKSDTLRHIRVKHAQSQNAVKFLRIMSIREASDSIEQYENMRLYKKIKNFNSVDSVASNSNSANEMSERQYQDTEIQQARSIITEYSETEQSSGQVHQECLEFYRCPFCKFKNVDKHVMRRHLVIHFSGSQTVRVSNPVYRCSLCTFRSKWQFFVKKHITTHHLSVRNAYVLKYPAKSRSSKALDTEEEADNGINYAEEEEEEDSENHQDCLEIKTETTPAILMQTQTTTTTKPQPEPETPSQTLEKITLTDHDGHQFEAAYHVTNAGIDRQPKKGITTYICDTCPYTTKAYTNLKQHLHGHAYQTDFVRCRYCSFNVSHPRLLRQHEILHQDFEELPEHNALKRSTSLSTSSNNKPPIQV